MQQQLANIQNKYPDFNDLEHEIQAELKNNPQALRIIQMNPGTAEMFIEAAYNKVKANKLLQQSLQAQQQNVQAQQEQQKRVLKAQRKRQGFRLVSLNVFSGGNLLKSEKLLTSLG